MNRKTIPQQLHEFAFNPLAFESLLAFQVPFVVLPGRESENQKTYIINLAWIRELAIDPNGLISIRFHADLENKWKHLDAEQSAALAHKVSTMEATIKTFQKQT